MRVLGIDPGIATTGIAVIDDEKGKSKLIHSQAILTSASSTLPHRLVSIHEQLSSLVQQFRPDICSLEKLFFATNAKTAFTVGQARGVIQFTLGQHHIDVAEYTPLQVKMAIVGYGAADKKQIQIMVKQILKLEKPLTPDDVADAAAIALTHCFSYKMKAYWQLS